MVPVWPTSPAGFSSEIVDSGEGAVGKLMLDTGMRPEEVFRMEFANLDFERRTAFNPFGKTPAGKKDGSHDRGVWNLLKSRAIAAEGQYAFPFK